MPRTVKWNEAMGVAAVKFANDARPPKLFRLLRQTTVLLYLPRNDGRRHCEPRRGEAISLFFFIPHSYVPPTLHFTLYTLHILLALSLFVFRIRAYYHQRAFAANDFTFRANLSNTRSNLHIIFLSELFFPLKDRRATIPASPYRRGGSL